MFDTATIKDVTMKNETEKIKLGNSLENPGKAEINLLSLEILCYFIFYIFVLKRFLACAYKGFLRESIPASCDILTCKIVNFLV